MFDELKLAIGQEAKGIVCYCDGLGFRGQIIHTFKAIISRLEAAMGAGDIARTRELTASAKRFALALCAILAVVADEEFDAGARRAEEHTASLLRTLVELAFNLDGIDATVHEDESA